MKRLFKVDKSIYRVHKYKYVKPNCTVMPNYFRVDRLNPELYIQFEEGELKIYALNSKSIKKDLEVFPVSIIDPFKLDFICYDLKTKENIIEAFNNHFELCEDEAVCDFKIFSKDKYKCYKFKEESNTKKDYFKKIKNFFTF